MKCCECGRGMDEGLVVIPLYELDSDVKKCYCLECLPEGIEASMPTDLIDMCKIFTETFGGIYKGSSEADTKINLCDTCMHSAKIPTCLPSNEFVVWGNGLGNDNIIKCKNYEERPGAVMLGKLVSLNKKLDSLLERRNS